MIGLEDPGKQLQAVAAEIVALRGALGIARTRELSVDLLAIQLSRGHCQMLRAMIGVAHDYPRDSAVTMHAALREGLRRLTRHEADEIRSLLRLDARGDLTAGAALSERAADRRCSERTYRDRVLPLLALSLARGLTERAAGAAQPTGPALPAEMAEVITHLSRYFEAVTTSAHVTIGEDGHPTVIRAFRKLRTKASGILFYGHRLYYEEADVDFETSVARGGAPTGLSFDDSRKAARYEVIRLDNPTVRDGIIDLELVTEVARIRKPPTPEFSMTVSAAASALKALQLKIEFPASTKYRVYSGYAPRDDFPADAESVNAVTLAEGVGTYSPSGPYLMGYSYGMWWEDAAA